MSIALTPAQLNDCANEPIQIPGSIQPHGLLIALRATDFTILQISKNVSEIIGVDANELLHQPLSRIMNVEPVREAVKRLGERTPRLLNPIPIEIVANGRTKGFDGILHRSGRVINLELEPHVKGTVLGFGGFYEKVRDVASRFFNSSDVQETCDIACEEIRKLTGFDRVMIYRFDHDWHGSVIAESINDGVRSYLNHHFPASDIPKQARDLYAVNWLRIIPDVDYQPSPLVPQTNPLTDRPLDLSNAVLRSVSPIHVEYMKNMGLGASMSISILRDRQLWGLISCHHLTPLFLSYDVRVACEFLGQTLSGQIQVREAAAETDHKLQLKTIYTQLLSEGGVKEDFATVLEQNAAALLALTESQGAAICLSGGCKLIGRTPNHEENRDLIAWLMDKGEDFYFTDHLTEVYPPAAKFQDVASGLLAARIAHAGWVIWYRPSQEEDIVWGGNPHESKTWSESEMRYHPRASFATWTESVRGRSKKWSIDETDVALEFQKAASGLVPSAYAGAADSARSERVSVSQTQSAVTAPAPSRTTETPGNLALIDGFADLSLALLDDRGIVRSWSKGAAKMLGYSKAEMIGRPLASLLPETDALQNRASDIMSKAARDGRCIEELWLYRKDGTSFWAKIGLNKTEKIADVDGTFSLIIEDFSEERAAEEELKATKVAAEAANRTKSAFLANISHEIRTPLGAVLGFAELMSANGVSDVDRGEMYERVKRNGQQLSTLINDLLDMSKAEAGRLEVEMIDFDLRQLLTDIEQTFIPRAEEKFIEMSFQLAPSLPSALRSDPTRIRQILINLLSNAIKFTHEHGKIVVSVSTKQTPAGEDQLVIRVKDSGRGMTDEEQQRLFQPFAQADVSMTRKFGGTGLGLFISRRLARALGGELRIESSKIDEGTTFLAEIDISQKPAALATPSKTAAAPKKNALEGMRVLLVDDSPDNRELISIFLRGAAAKVETAENGALGIERLERENFDVVLMDIQMPVMDGQAAMRELKSRGFKTPVIALTAHAMKEEREASLALGFSGYLTKPVSRADLIASVEAFRK